MSSNACFLGLTSINNLTTSVCPKYDARCKAPHPLLAFCFPAKNTHMHCNMHDQWRFEAQATKGRAQAGPIAPAPIPVSWSSMIFFAKITQISDFFAFPNCTKVGKFAASIKRPKNKSASALGGFAPLTLWLGALPLDPTRGSAPRSPL